MEGAERREDRERDGGGGRREMCVCMHVWKVEKKNREIKKKIKKDKRK